MSDSDGPADNGLLSTGGETENPHADLMTLLGGITNPLLPDFPPGTGLLSPQNINWDDWNKMMAMPVQDIPDGPDIGDLSKEDYQAVMPYITGAFANPAFAGYDAGPGGQTFSFDDSGAPTPADGGPVQIASAQAPAADSAPNGLSGSAARKQSDGVAGQPWLDQKDQAFFDQQYPAASKVAKQLGVDPTLLLGVAAEESGYGTQLAGANNPFGATPHGDSTHGLDYPSFDAAWQQWANDWGKRVAGTGSDKAAFLSALLQDNRGVPGTDGRGSYNPGDAQGGDSKWSKKVGQTIDGVRKRLPNWM